MEPVRIDSNEKKHVELRSLFFGAALAGYSAGLGVPLPAEYPMACALAHKACTENFRTRYTLLSRLLETLQIVREEDTYLKTLKQLARTDVLVLDDWGLHRIGPPQ